MTRRVAARTISACCIATFAACVATETGNPSLSIDPTAIEGMVLQDEPMLPLPPTTEIRGRPGGVDPPRGEVFIWALETVSPPARAPVAADGSWEATIPVGSGAPLRLQVRDGDVVSQPVDARVFDPDGFVLTVPANACVHLSPEATAPVPRAGGEVRVRVLNECDHSVTRERARLRVPSAELSVVDDGALALEPGTMVDIVVTSAGTPSEENILLVPIEGPAAELRAISLLP